MKKWKQGALILGLCLALAGGCQKSDAPTAPPEPQPEDTQGPTVIEPEEGGDKAKQREVNPNLLEDTNLGQWGRGMSSIILARNRMDPQVFGGMEPEDASAQLIIALLKRDWGIDSRETLLAQLQSLLTGGHRSQFMEDAQFISQLPEEELEQLKASQEGEDAIYLSEVVRNWEKWGDRGVMAWDLCRGAQLAAWGSTAGYVSLEEATALVQPFAALAQEHFGSWDELMDNYLDGYAWWACEDVADQTSEYQNRQRLFTDLKEQQSTEDPLYDPALFKQDIIPVPDVSWQDLLAETQD